MHVSNDGTAAHNLSIADTDLTTAGPRRRGGGRARRLVARARRPTRCCAESPGTPTPVSAGRSTITEDGAVASGEAHAGPRGRRRQRRHGLPQAMTDAMLATMAAFPAETEGAGNELPGADGGSWPTGRRCSTSPMRAGRLGGRAGRRHRRGMDYNGIGPGPDAPARRRRHTFGCACRTSSPSPPTYTGTASTSRTRRRRGTITQDLIEPGKPFAYEFIPTTRRRHVPRAPPRSHARCRTACSPPSSSARCHYRRVGQ